MHCVGLAAAITQTNGSGDAPSLSKQMKTFIRYDDCTRDDQHRDYFIVAHFESCGADQQMKSESWS